MKVLLIESDSEYVTAMTRMFAQSSPHIELETATSLKAAIAALQCNSFELVVSDADLPDSSGLSTLQALRASCSSVPLIVLSSEQQDLTSARAFEMGADDYLVKQEIDARLLQHSMRHAVERKRLLLDNERLRQQAERAHRAKDEFVALLSHELRTPLQGILGWAVLLRDGKMPPSSAVRALESIEQNAREQDRIIDDLREMSRIAAGKLVLEMVPVELKAVIEAAVESVHFHANPKQVKIDCQFNSDVPPIMGDAGRLQQALWNILSNSVRFSRQGGRIEIVLQRSGADAEIKVILSGNGVSPQALVDAFEVSPQTDVSPAPVHTGLSFGLGIVRPLIEHHRGTIQVLPDGEGKATVFSIRLPISEAAR